MASLWRVLALSWLGGVASPLMLDDPAIVGGFAPTSAVIEQHAGELPALDASWTEIPSDEADPPPSGSSADR